MPAAPHLRPTCRGRKGTGVLRKELWGTRDYPVRLRLPTGSGSGLAWSTRFGRGEMASCYLQTGLGGGPCTLPRSLGGVIGLHASDEASRSRTLRAPAPGKKRHRGLWETSGFLEPPRAERDLRSSLPSPGGEAVAPQTKATRPKSQRLSVPEPGLEFRLPSPAQFTACAPVLDCVSQVDSSWGPGSPPRPHVCCGGKRKLLNFPGEVTHIDSEITQIQPNPGNSPRYHNRALAPGGGQPSSVTVGPVPLDKGLHSPAPQLSGLSEEVTAVLEEAPRGEDMKVLLQALCIHERNSIR